ncbi:hypothetical protein LCGC14_1020540 [marine sediment metagenome]|uniref:Uncharacterized protein n=1 Tax=marine sediment metagenome TaxID=412755 RepID=A0A0F9N226_9ZZZZ|nr:hypothetical protein [Candidatus Aminicenantes bacterium]
MAKQVYVFYEKTNPFPGWIRMYGGVDPNQTPDGSTLAEHLVTLKTKYPNSDYYLFPLGTEVDPETQKFDIGTSALVDIFDQSGNLIDPSDITPKAQAVSDEAQKAQDIIDNLPSWAAIESTFNSIRNDGAAATTVSELKLALGRLLDFEEKHARITYWLAKNSRT